MLIAKKNLLGIEFLEPSDIYEILDKAKGFTQQDLSGKSVAQTLDGYNIINIFFENSTRTQTSFEIAGKRLGALVTSINVKDSSIKKGETLFDTALTLNAMKPDLIVIRHPYSGAVQLLSEKIDCSVINAGDGKHEHPTQALLDAMTVLRRKNRLSGLTVTICGDIAHSRVARSNIFLFGKLGNSIRLVGPATLVPDCFKEFGVEVFNNMREGLKGADVVMMLRLQKERMDGGYVPSEREYFHFYGLDEEKLSQAKSDAIILHPGPMNRGVEIDSELADDLSRSAIQEQVEMGVSIRMAVIESLIARVIDK
ncbi:MAG: aspartate carbamoyltransferase catalytic subunit [Rhodobacterales bacterium]|nr:aspartate carbamoyltransferase catalytic subunit [Rhodobacterales bacterium]